MRVVDFNEAIATLKPAEAVEAIRRPLLAGFDPATDPHRQKVALPHGEMHLLPSALDGAVGVKVLGIQPPGSTEQVPLVQGSYVLMDGRTLTPEMLIDAAALTTLRTPAVSVAGVLERLRASTDVLEVAIFGTGAQARAHAETLTDTLRGIREVRCTFISRHDPVAPAVSKAELVVTATSSLEPILDAEHLLTDATVISVGAHTTTTRELHEDVLVGAQVVVEDLGAAKREAGDVVIAVEKGALSWDDVLPMRDVVRGDVTLDPDRRVVFKTVGMPWEDLAVAGALAHASKSRP
ncbi:ornithine cyclodeaminase family protein [Corynebacterium sp. Q4381]|uniref:ornithine cyclodeaminase family protein n=1 Tax=Corynebacterium sp. Marseille-Q4381 TaxID=3121597 RepID=UPI002FE6741B